MMRILFCNIAWMKEYRGNEDGKDTPLNGGSYVDETGDAHEKYNFTPVNMEGKEGLYCLGFFETKSHNGKDVKIIAKIENQEGINNISDIINVSDAIMVARGDLWAEIPIETIPDHQMRIIKKTKTKWKKVIVATQMLESMIINPIPTRAEISDIFYAVMQWADYLMLSWETSVGKHPIKCVKIMNKVIAEAQKYI